LPKAGIQNLLVIGIDTVSIANSAKSAGYKIYAVDYFGDIDLQRICSGYQAIIEQKPGKSCGKIESKFKPEAFLRKTMSLLEKYEIDAILLSSGLDDYFDILFKLNDLVPILGNSPKVVEKVRKKRAFFNELQHLGIRYPETTVVKDVDEAKAAAVQIGYPVVVKPLIGFGGTDIRMAQSPKELERAFFKVSLAGRDVSVQKFIDGIHASVSFLATYENVKVLSINEQLLGLRAVFQRKAFGYCGNIVPLCFTKSTFVKCKYIVERIALHFGLIGSNGIDLVISKEGIPYVLEVNPRFQATLECVERVLGINLVESHINAVLNGSLPTIREKTSTFCTRLILYAPKRIIAPDMTSRKEVRDVPFHGVIIEKGEPICSIISEGRNRNLSFQKARKLAKSMYSMLRPV